MSIDDRQSGNARYNVDAGDADFEPLDELLARYDDQLVRSLDHETPSSADESADLDPSVAAQLRSAQSCLRMIERVRRRSPDTLSDLSTAGTDRWLLVDAEPSGEPPWPATIGRFRIERELGRGGYGVVFLAEDTQLGRRVALKVPRPEALVTSELRGRFFREAKAAAGLSHANVLPVFEGGRVGPICYIAYAYCPGPTLADWLSAGRDVTAEMAAQIIATLADAVQHAHSRGVLHRDLKPANILIDDASLADGAASLENESRPVSVPDSTIDSDTFCRSLRIADFGLAKFIGAKPVGELEPTKTTAIVGTPSYMAPEQALGDNRNVQKTADIYALGAMFYELLVGTPPFAEDSHLATLEAVRTRDPRPPTSVRRGVPRDLEAICLKCLEKDPQSRYAAASDLADDLRRFLNGEPIVARRAGHWERWQRWARRNPLVAALYATVACLVLALSIGATVAAVYFREQRQAAVETSIRAVAAERRAQQDRDLSEERLFRALVEQARANRLSDRAGQRFNSLAALGEAMQLRVPDRSVNTRTLRDDAVAALTLPDLRQECDWPVASASVRSGVAFDPDIERYAIAEDQGRAIVVRRLEDNAEICRLAGPLVRDHDPQLQFSPGGALLMAKWQTAQSTRLAVWQPPNSTPLWQTALGGSWHHANVDFSPDGESIALAQDNGSIAIHDALTGERRAKLPGASMATLVRFDPQGRHLAVYRKGRIELVSAPSGRVIRSVDANTPIESMAFSPDGRILATADDVGRVKLWNASHLRLRVGAQPLMLNPLENSYINQTIHVCFSHRGDLLASTGWDGATRLWNPIDGSQVLRVPGFAAQFSRDDRRLGFGKFGPRVGRWRVAPPREHFVLIQDWQATKIRTVQFDPTGRLVGAASIRGVAVWDLVTSKAVGAYPIDNSRGGVIYDDANRQVITNSRSGILCWPVGWRESQETMTYWLGLPNPLPLPDRFSPGPIAISRDGRWLAAGMRDAPGRVIISDLRNRHVQRIIEGHEHLYYVDISVDGRWVATGTQHGRDVKVWDTTNGRLATTVPCASANVAFTPDASMLVVGDGNSYSFLKVGSWTPSWRVPRNHSGGLAGQMAFAADAHLAVLAGGPRNVVLLSLDSGQPLATFSAPDTAVISSLAIGNDGSHVAAGMENGRVHVWNLHLIRRELDMLGLDFERSSVPPYSAAWHKPSVRLTWQFGDSLVKWARVLNAVLDQDARP
ncbi:MAG: hypothetical protein DCC68_16220 [Planctomycetota bacterium]|nr:MAG: hypothetical protein DCC68_16220 [Planctomycetota bacterium]